MPLAVVTTGACRYSASLVRLSDARAMCTPPPAQITGDWDAASTRAARSISVASGVAGAYCSDSRRVTSSWTASTGCPTCRRTGRGRPVRIWTHGLAYQVRHFCGPLGLSPPLGQRHEPALVGRVGIVPVQVRPGHHKHRRRCVVGRCEARRGVEEARTLHDDDSRDLTSCAEVAVGHVRRGLLVAHRDVRDVLRLPQRVHYLVLPRARYPEHGAYALALERLN